MDPFTEKLLQKAEQRSKNLGISTSTNCSLIDFHKKQFVENSVNNKLNVVERKLDAKKNVENPTFIKRQFSVDKENMDLGIEINITTSPNVDIRVEVEEEEIDDLSNKGRFHDNVRVKMGGGLSSNSENLSNYQRNDKKLYESSTDNYSILRKGPQKFKKLAALADSINSWENETSRESNKVPLKNNIPKETHAKQTKSWENETSRNTKVPLKNIQTTEMHTKQTPIQSGLSKFNSPTKIPTETVEMYTKQTAIQSGLSKFNSPTKIPTETAEIHTKQTPIQSGLSKFNSPTKIPTEIKQKQDFKSSGEAIPVSNRTKLLNWDKNVMNSLEAQGFQRRESTTTKYTYQYDDNKKKFEQKTDEQQNLKKPANVNVVNNSKDFKTNSDFKNFQVGLVSGKARVFGNKGQDTQKDPAEMSLKERMQLFEKNKGDALIPKAAFGMAIPVKKVNSYENIKKTEYKFIPNKDKVSENISTADFIKQNQVLNKVAQKYQQNVEKLNNEKTTPQNAEKQMNTKSLYKRRSPSSITPDAKDCTDDNKSSDEKRPKTVATNRLYPILTDFEDTDSEINNCTTATVTTDEKNHDADDWSIDSIESDDDAIQYDEQIIPEKQSNVNKTKEVRYAAEATYFGDDCSSNTYDSTDIEREIMEDSDTDDISSENVSFDRKERKETDKSDSFCYKKQLLNNENVSSSSKSFKSDQSPVKSELNVRKSNDSNMVTLVHTVSFYRKQKSSSNTATPIRSVRREQIAETNSALENNGESSSDDDSDMEKDEEDIVKEKIKLLLDEVCKQQQIIGQTSQALNLCAATIEFAGSTESVEGERHLLVATHRRQAALDEIQRLRVDRSLRPPGGSREIGRITVEEITLPLRHDYIRKLSANAITGHHLVCLIKYNEHVLATKTVPTLPGLLAVKFPNALQLNNIYADFRVSVEIYGMTAQREILPHEVKYHINLSKKTPQKKHNDSKLFMPLVQSPAGPNVVRTPALIQYGFAIFSLREIKRNSWTLNQICDDSPLDGIIKMKVNCELSISVQHRGFLTMFEDLSGFGAWHRRWCYLNGHILNYWKYPDDEKKKAPIGSIDLYTCRSSKVAIAPRDICARLNTMLLENHRPARDDDNESLLIVPKGEITIVRTLLSADTKEERNEWCAYLNKALTLIRTWDPPKQQQQ